MIEVSAVIVNARGLHARPSAKLAKLAAAYSSTLTIHKGRRKADAKSVAALLMLAAAAGSEIKITAAGSDEKQAAAALLELIAAGFSDDAVVNNPQNPVATPAEIAGERQVHKVSGIGIGEAVVTGQAHIHTSGAAEVPRYRIAKRQLAAEIARYEKALAQVRGECEMLRRQTAHLPGAAEIKPFIDLYLMLLSDGEFLQQTPALVRRRLINAEWALKERVDTIGDSFRHLQDDYLRERYRDIEQVMQRLLLAMGESKRPPRAEISAGENAILIASDLDPADVIRLSQQGYKGFITESGGGNSHTAILARSMNVPALIGARGILPCLQHNAPVLLDARREVAIVNPTADDIKKHRQAERKKSAARRRHKGSGKGVATRDGEQVHLNTNIELPDEVAAAMGSGADGIGLFRSEFLFMHRPDLPGEDEQFEIYRSVLAAMAPLPVVIRTLDIGGDKMPPTVEKIPIGANPALGVRAIRYCLSLPDLFMTQLRALAKPLSFYSVGTNDLIQYMMAVDRGNEALAPLCDPLHPAVLKMLSLIVANAVRARRPLTLCGELAGDAALTPLMLGLGLRQLSMAPASIDEVRACVKKSDCGAYARMAQQALRAPDPAAVRRVVQEFAPF